MVKRALDLENDKGEFIVSQLFLRKKLELAVLAVRISGLEHQPRWVKRAEKTISSIDEVNNIRILMAHQTFRSDDKGGILFDKAGAQKKVTQDHRKKDELERDCKRLDKIKDDLDLIYRELRPIPNLGLAVNNLILGSPVLGRPTLRILNLPDEEER